MYLERFPTNPLLTVEATPELGDNINGPSLIRVPRWLPNRLGNYYLYFAHHQGEFIRLAYADTLAGPWQIYAPGTLQLAQTPCHGHIASPDVHVDEANQRIIMYYHGPTLDRKTAAADPITQCFPTLGGQRSFVATSPDGIHFTSGQEVLGVSYFRIFPWAGATYALAMPGIFYRSQDGFSDFRQGPIHFTSNMRHSALLRRDHLLYIFYSDVGDTPEHIKVATVDLRPDWQAWQPSTPTSVLFPEEPYEGGDLPLAPSERGSIHERVRQLRDPGIFEEAGRTYLLYSIAGEAGLALAAISDL